MPAALAVDGAWRFDEPPGPARSFEEAARHGPDWRVPRLGLERAQPAFGEPQRARAEPEVRRRLRSDLATILAAGRPS
jgi:hypothetical protein